MDGAGVDAAGLDGVAGRPSGRGGWHTGGACGAGGRWDGVGGDQSGGSGSGGRVCSYGGVGGASAGSVIGGLDVEVSLSSLLSERLL